MTDNDTTTPATPADGGLAFPIMRYFPSGHGRQEHGMTLRDWFAGQVMAAMYANPEYDDVLMPEHASEAYRMVDAMLAARESQS